MLIDTHNHTRHYSPDAKMTIDELIDAASKRGLSVVGITEHYEYDNPDPNDNIQTFDIDSYVKEFPSWREKCPKSLELLMGIEFGYQTHTAKVIDEIAAKYPFDTVVLSNHLFRGIDLCYSEEAKLISRKERNSEYIGKMAEMVEKVDNFCVAAHFDYVCKYLTDKNDGLSYSDCPKEFDRFFEALIYKEKALEINTATSVKRNTKPDPEILKRYLDMHGKLITLSSDAHVKENVGIVIADFSEYLRSFGIKEICYFKNKQPQLCEL